MRVRTICLAVALLVVEPVVALAADATTHDIASDYAMVRRLGLALAAIAFFVAMARIGTTELPHERGRAQDLLLKASVAFVLLAGDRMVAQGLAGWFGVSLTTLPAFWQ